MDGTQLNYRPLSTARRALLIGLGTTTLGLGIAGMFLPGVPTTVFLLITIGCYTRSSERMYRWVLSRPWLQRPLQTAFAFKQKGSLPVRVKLLAQAVAWSSVVLTVFTGARPIIQLITVAFAASCTVAMAIIKTEGTDASARAWSMAPDDIALKFGYGALAGAVAGAISGLAGAVILRFVANLAGPLPPFDPGQTIAIVAAGIGIGAACGLVYAGLRRALPTNKWLNGALFGALVALAAGVVLYLAPHALAPIATIGSRLSAIAAALFVLDMLAFGVITCLTFGRLERQ
jgi:uncharacterized membrane protein YbaN (DUF454 family)